MLMALCALVFSIYEARETRRFYRLRTQPYVYTIFYAGVDGAGWKRV